MPKLGKVLGNRLVTLVAAHLFIPAGSLNVGLFLAQEGVTSLAGPEEATLRDSGCFVAEQQKAGSVQFKAGRHIWFRFMSTLSEDASLSIYHYLSLQSTMLLRTSMSSRAFKEEETIIFHYIL